MDFQRTLNGFWESFASYNHTAFDTVFITGLPNSIRLEEIRHFFSLNEGPCLCLYLPIQPPCIAIQFNMPNVAQRVVLRYNNSILAGHQIHVFPASNGLYGISSNTLLASYLAAQAKPQLHCSANNKGVQNMRNENELKTRYGRPALWQRQGYCRNSGKSTTTRSNYVQGASLNNHKQCDQPGNKTNKTAGNNNMGKKRKHSSSQNETMKHKKHRPKQPKDSEVTEDDILEDFTSITQEGCQDDDKIKCLAEVSEVTGQPIRNSIKDSLVSDSKQFPVQEPSKLSCEVPANSSSATPVRNLENLPFTKKENHLSSEVGKQTERVPELAEEVSVETKLGVSELKEILERANEKDGSGKSDKTLAKVHRKSLTVEHKFTADFPKKSKSKKKTPAFVGNGKQKKKGKIRRKVRKNSRKRAERNAEKKARKAVAASARVGETKELNKQRFMKIFDVKKREIEQEYERECSTLLSVVKTLTSKDPSLNEKLQKVVQESLMELGDYLVKKLEATMESVSLV